MRKERTNPEIDNSERRFQNYVNEDLADLFGRQISNERREPHVNLVENIRPKAPQKVPNNIRKENRDFNDQIPIPRQWVDPNHFDHPNQIPYRAIINDRRPNRERPDERNHYVQLDPPNYYQNIEMLPERNRQFEQHFVDPRMQGANQHVDHRLPPNYPPNLNQFPNPNFEDQARAPHNNNNPIKKWNFVFSGDGHGFSLSDFFSRIELNARAERVTNHQLFLSFHYLLSGEAEKWYRGNYREFQDWHDLVRQMRNHFLPRNYNNLLRDEISNRQQGRQESFAHFITDMKILFQRAYPPLEEDYKIYVVQKNMLPEYSSHLVSVNFITLNQLVEFCKRLDENKLIAEKRAISAQFVPQTLMEPACFQTAQPHPPFREGFRNFGQNRQVIRNNPMRVAEVTQVNEPLYEGYYHSQYPGYYPDTFHPDQYYNYGSNQYSQPPSHLNQQPDNFNQAHLYFKPPVHFKNQTYYPQNQTAQYQVTNQGHNIAAVESSNIKCWNCDEIGHGYNACQKGRLRIFCFQCGEIGKTIRSCSHENARPRPVVSRGPQFFRRSGNGQTEEQSVPKTLP